MLCGRVGEGGRCGIEVIRLTPDATSGDGRDEETPAKGGDTFRAGGETFHINDRGYDEGKRN